MEERKEFTNINGIYFVCDEVARNKRVAIYNTAIDMINDTKLISNQMCQTNGYFTEADGGSATYIITNKKSNYSVTLNNGLYANLIYDKNINMLSLGVDNRGKNECGKNIISIIESANINDTLYFPSGTYLINNIITITKPINLLGNMGDSIHISENMNGTVFKMKAHIEIKHSDVTIDGISLLANNYTSGLLLNPSVQPANVSMNIRLRNMIIRDFTDSGIKINRIITSLLENIYCGNCGIGINFVGSTQTSIKLDKCWSLNCKKHGFLLNTCQYCELSNCCCDDCGDVGYHIENCNSIVFNSCACETSGKTAFYIKNSLGVVFNGCLSVNCNNGSSYSDTSCVNIEGSNVTINNITEKTPANGIYSVKWDNSSLVEVSGSTLVKPIITTKRKGLIRDMFMARPNYDGLSEWGMTFEINGSNGYVAPGDKSMTWLVFIVINNTTTGAYEGTKTTLAVGGNTVVESGANKNCNGFAIRIS